MKYVVVLPALFALINLLTGCGLPKGRGTFDTKPGGGGTVEWLDKIIWLNHHDIVVSDVDPFTLSTNGTTLFIKPKTGGTFPKRRMLSIFVSTLPSDHNITGVRVCYSIIGDQAETKIDQLRLSQYRISGSPIDDDQLRYYVQLDDSTVANKAPAPPAGGFAWDDPAGFVCINSSPGERSPCLDPNVGTVSASIGASIGDADDMIEIKAMGLHYNTSCTPT